MVDLVQRYINTYKGINREIWLLSLVMLINRSGSMVLPFLSVYLKGHLLFSTHEVGILLTLFGLGSMVGTFIGGWLTDRFGFFNVQLLSLIASGAGYIALEPLRDFTSLAIGFFLITLISDCFRPANASAIAAFSNPENITRAYSLNRMAINLGFALGPAVGGLVALYNYSWLFYIDGITCWLGGIILLIYFYRHRWKKNRAPKTDLSAIDPINSPYRDKQFILAVLLTSVFAIVFFQLFFTLPLFYREVSGISETSVGLLLALNGLIVFALEMPLVQYLTKQYSFKAIIAIGCVLTAISFGILAINSSLAWLVMAMFFLSLGEIAVMPFLSAYTAKRSNSSNRGKYMGLYGMAYSLAFFIAPGFGTFLIEYIGYQLLWIALLLIGLLTAWTFWLVLGNKVVRD